VAYQDKKPFYQHWEFAPSENFVPSSVWRAPLIIQQLLFKIFWHIVILCQNASPIQYMSLMALKQLQGTFKDLATLRPS
jgi:hypothetical protein